MALCVMCVGKLEGLHVCDYCICAGLFLSQEICPCAVYYSPSSHNVASMRHHSDCWLKKLLPSSARPVGPQPAIMAVPVMCDITEVEWHPSWYGLI